MTAYAYRLQLAHEVGSDRDEIFLRVETYGEFRLWIEKLHFQRDFSRISLQYIRKALPEFIRQH